MSSKNNPENRGQVTELRKYKGKVVKPVRFIGQRRNYIAAAYENGELALDPITGLPIPYKLI